MDILGLSFNTGMEYTVVRTLVAQCDGVLNLLGEAVWGTGWGRRGDSDAETESCQGP